MILEMSRTEPKFSGLLTMRLCCHTLIWNPTSVVCPERNPGEAGDGDEMDYSELKKHSNLKVLLQGPSGRGKTLNSCKVALGVAREGGRVLYLDTEKEGSTTMVSLVEDSESPYSEGDVRNIEYVLVSSFEEYMRYVDPENGYHDEFDLIVVDPIDHKHTFALRSVVEEQDAQSADWNEYPRIYDTEKTMMEKLQKPETNVLVTLDPESGSDNKPKGTQTNIEGYFGIVVDLKKNGDEWKNRVKNYVGNSEPIGVGVENLSEHLTEEVLERSELQ